jgi:hypothetical protein
MQKIYWVFWPSFMVAAVAEAVFFTVINPQELYLFGQPVHFSPVATYSIGFVAFWALCACSSMLTCFLQRSGAELNQKVGAGDDVASGQTATQGQTASPGRSCGS